MEYRMEAMVVSAVNTEAMAEFYRGVFEIAFDQQEMDGHVIYSGSAFGMEFTLVPAELTGVDAPSNPTHYDIYVSDLEEAIRRVEAHGGSTNGQLGEDDTTRAIGIFDPDGNFMVFKQRK